MRKPLIYIAILASILMLAGSHALPKLWQKVEDAARADKPKDEMKALEAVKKEARTRHLTWDFYDAGARYIRVASSVNWKMRDSLQAAFDKEIDAFGEPVAVFYHRRQGYGRQGEWSAEEFIAANKKKLLAGHNTSFYSEDWHLNSFKFRDWLTENLANDYEYARWSIAAYGVDRQAAVEALKKHFGSSYPMGALAEYLEAAEVFLPSGKSGGWEQSAVLQAFAEKYRGKAVALLAEEDILERRFNALGEGSAPSEAYRTLHSECKGLIARKSAFKGSEKALAASCTKAESLIEMMEAPSVQVSVSDGIATVALINTSEAELSIAQDAAKPLFSKTLSCCGSRFFVPDTVKIELPVLDDGSYTVNCIGTRKGGIAEGQFFKSDRPEISCPYSKFTISIALRRTSDGIGLWATDYLSGEPLGRIQVDLLDNREDGKLAESAELAISGFTTLPAAFSRKLDDKNGRYSLRARVQDGGITHLSESISPYRYYSYGSDDPGRINCSIITDRRAFNPDETVHFKAIIYYGSRSIRPAPKGERFRAVLKDTEGAVISSKELTTNEFGSISGEFKLERRQRNGWYRIYIERAGRDNGTGKDTGSGSGKGGDATIAGSSSGETIAGSSLLVDDFVLPSFDLEFDDPGELWLPLEKVVLSGSAMAYSGHSLNGANASWTHSCSGDTKEMGKIEIGPDGRFELAIPIDSTAGDWQWHSVSVKISDASGETQEFGKSFYLRKKSQTEKKTSYYFEDLGGDNLDLKVVAGPKPAWVLYEIYGSGDVLLASGLETLRPADGQLQADGQNAKAAHGQAEGRLIFSHRAEWPDAISLKVIYFQDKKQYSHTISRRRIDHRYDLPLEFIRFRDSSAPGQECSIGIRTAANAEIALSIFDKSTERFAANSWHALRAEEAPLPGISYNYRCGSNDSPAFIYRLRGGKSMMMKNAAMDAMPMAQMAVAEESAATYAAADAAGAVAEGGSEGILLREDFATTIAWEPSLRSDAAGNAEFRWRNADKLSTFYVQAFAHDKALRNDVLRREMKVSIPVKISLAEPKFLFAGDKYVLRAALANNLPEPVSGRLSVSWMNGADHKTAKVIAAESLSVTVPARGSVAENLEFRVPEGQDALGIKAVFVPDGTAEQQAAAGKAAAGQAGLDAAAGDAMFVSVPVFRPEQTLTEAHSAVLLAGADRAALERSLRGMFVNIDGAGAELREISILDMLREAIPEEIEPRSENAIDLARAIYASALADKVRARVQGQADAASKLRQCACEDGGFAWFPGMESSPRVTLVVAMRLRGLGIIDEDKAVHYIDRCQFSKDKKLKRSWWYVGISMEEYLHFRSFFPQVSFNEKPDADFRKAARKYLVPGKARGLNGAILAKARRMQTLRNLLGLSGAEANSSVAGSGAAAKADAGIALAKKLGVKLAASRKMRKSLQADLESLLQYAQPHKQGGIYYPNAVMPWRGLLESELYAHSIICNLLQDSGKGDDADGIRLWIMLQKETQHWESDPGYIEALACVLDASKEVLDTRVLALSATYTKPFTQIKAAGNGMAIKGPAVETVAASTATVSQATAAAKQDVPKIGDKLRLEWQLSSEENRSFVKVTLPFPAGLQPVDQTSGYRWSYYRSVLKDRIEYWYEAYPEEKISVSEEFYAVRAGEFQSAIPVLECLYAPHYRANSDPAGALSVAVD